MLFVIYGFYKEGIQSKRDELYDAHRTFLGNAAQHGVTIVVSGPLVEDDGTTPIGSLFVIEAADRANAETFHQADPFYVNGIWESTAITAFARKR